MILKFDIFLSLIDKKDKRWLFFLGAASAISGFLEIISISALMFIVMFSMKKDLPQSGMVHTLFSFFQINDPKQEIFILSILLIFLFIFKNLFTIFIDWTTVRYVRSVERKTGIRLFTNYLDSPYIFKVRRKTADLLNILIGENVILSSLYINSLLLIFSGAVTTACILCWMLYRDFVTFSIITLVIAMTLFFTHKWTKGKLRQKGSQVAKLNQDNNESVMTPLQGFKETKIYNASSFFVQDFRRNSFKLSKINAYTGTIQKLPKALLEMVVVTTVIILMMWAIHSGAIDAFFVNISVFAFSLFRLLPLMIQFGTQVSNMQRGIIALDTIYAELHHTEALIAEQKKQLDTSLTEIPFNKDIVVKNVSFAYTEDTANRPKWVLKDASLVIEKNKTYAFVGNSGGGKTTLVDIIVGLLTPAKGEVLVDGLSIQKSISHWWKKIGYIPQHIYLTNSTIRANIAYGLDDADIDEEKIKRAIKIANLEALVHSLEQGDKTIIGENGMQLSGGQRQRIGIARALYHDPDVLILDEATASLDNISEFEIMDAIEKLSNQKTIIIIAHRLSTIQRADKIFVLSEGKIIDEGNFQYLSEHSPLMKRMLDPAKHKS